MAWRLELCQEATLLVDLEALAANYRMLVAEAAPAIVAPVVKADAYGLGGKPVVERLWAEGARIFFVARIFEAEALRAMLGAAIDPEIWVLDGCLDGQAERFITAGATPVINSLGQADVWSRQARAMGTPLAAVLHVETGLNRLGLSHEDVSNIAGDERYQSTFNIVCVMSHLACADDTTHPLNDVQLQCFRRLVSLFPGAAASLAASDGLMLGPDYAFQMVRPGVSLFGGGARGKPDQRVQPVATLHAPILQTKDLRPGDAVGYGATFVADAPMRIAIVGAGYADGIPRRWRGRGWVLGRACSVIGRISMDLSVFDVTHIPGVSPGDAMELFGANLSVDEMAEDADTIAYEVLVRVGGRVKRVYLQDGEARALWRKELVIPSR
jgi:alanine racemase